MRIQDIDKFLSSLELSSLTFYYAALRDANYQMESYGKIAFAMKNLKHIKAGIEKILGFIQQYQNGTFEYVSQCEGCNCNNAGRFGGYECDMYYETTPYERIGWVLNDSLALSPLTQEITEKSMTADLARSLGFNRFFSGALVTIGEDGKTAPLPIDKADLSGKKEFIESKMAVYRMNSFQENVELAKSICALQSNSESDFAMIETIFTTGLSTSEFADRLLIEAEEEYAQVLQSVNRTIPIK